MNMGWIFLTHLHLLEARGNRLILQRNSITGVWKVEGLPIVNSDIVSSRRREVCVTVLAWMSRLTGLPGMAQAPESIIWKHLILPHLSSPESTATWLPASCICERKPLFLNNVSIKFFDDMGRIDWCIALNDLQKLKKRSFTLRTFHSVCLLHL